LKFKKLLILKIYHKYEKYNTLGGIMKTINEEGNYNCLGYALNKRKWMNVHHFWQIINKPRNEKTDEFFFKRIKPILRAEGYIYTSELPKEGSCIVARYGKNDFHFMKRVNGEWSHKRGGLDVEKTTEEEVLSDQWFNPGNENCVDQYYDSRIFIFKKVKLKVLYKILQMFID